MRPAKILETMSEFVVGVDLGQKQDYTALCVVERAELMLDDRDPRTWQCRRDRSELADRRRSVGEEHIGSRLGVEPEPA